MLSTSILTPSDLLASADGVFVFDLPHHVRDDELDERVHQRHEARVHVHLGRGAGLPTLRQMRTR
jgi:hypothetical protein